MNARIIVSIVIIGVTGIINSWTVRKPFTYALMGTFIFFLVLSMMDAIGGIASTLAGGLAVLAAVYIVLTRFPWQLLINMATKGHA